MTGVRWEYRAEVRGGPVPLVWLNEMGAEGWEVVGWEPAYDPTTGSVQAQHGRVWLFKRLVMEHPSIVEDEREEVPPLEERPQLHYDMERVPLPGASSGDEQATYAARRGRPRKHIEGDALAGAG